MEVHEINNRISKTSWFFEKFNRMNNSLYKLRKKTQITIHRSEQRGIIMDFSETMKGHTINNASILENLDEKDKYLETHKLPKLIKEETKI